MAPPITQVISELRSRRSLTQEALARTLGVSFVSINRWERGVSKPSPAQAQRLIRLHAGLIQPTTLADRGPVGTIAFASRGVREPRLPLFEEETKEFPLSPEPQAPILDRVLASDNVFRGTLPLADLLARHKRRAVNSIAPPDFSLSAGKNTYTYDAHTYHTKVPPQGIAQVLRHYLPKGGLVLDPFAGSGMTGVAASVEGIDCVLTELSPAACFIAREFVARIDSGTFASAVRRVLQELRDLRRTLYTTTCRECGRQTELLYVVWSYNVICGTCQGSFRLWDHCRHYGARVRDHKILTEFPCPHCKHALKKSRLKRTIAEPVLVGYKCCGSRQTEKVHPPDKQDLSQTYAFEVHSPVAEGFYPDAELPEGVNLSQPRRHGLTSIDRFYTPRNLAAMSHLWRTIHRIEDPDIAAAVAFVFTSLYQRVTRLSEFRFWGGSGNTPRFNVPFIFNESNVFLSFDRKARTIQDHLDSTARQYRGDIVVAQASATDLRLLPPKSIDLVFTDPPFGANINYSEMNILWEAWLGSTTDSTQEAIINRAQGKGISEYQSLMTAALQECHRVLRDGSWLVMVFMNSSAEVWGAVQRALAAAGFVMVRADVFDKEHGTFKQFVSANTAGCDLMLHCRKADSPNHATAASDGLSVSSSVRSFLRDVDLSSYRVEFLHVDRESEPDHRRLYSEWVATRLRAGDETIGFAEFREIVKAWDGRAM